MAGNCLRAAAGGEEAEPAAGFGGGAVGLFVSLTAVGGSELADRLQSADGNTLSDFPPRFSLN